MQWQQSSYVTRSPQETKYKYVGIRLLLTMTKVLAKCADYLMIVWCPFALGGCVWQLPLWGCVWPCVMWVSA